MLFFCFGVALAAAPHHASPPAADPPLICLFITSPLQVATAYYAQDLPEGVALKTNLDGAPLVVRGAGGGWAGGPWGCIGLQPGCRAGNAAPPGAAPRQEPPNQPTLYQPPPQPPKRQVSYDNGAIRYNAIGSVAGIAKNAAGTYQDVTIGDAGGPAAFCLWGGSGVGTCWVVCAGFPLPPLATRSPHSAGPHPLPPHILAQS